MVGRVLVKKVTTQRTTNNGKSSPEQHTPADHRRCLSVENDWTPSLAHQGNAFGSSYVHIDSITTSGKDASASVYSEQIRITTFDAKGKHCRGEHGVVSSRLASTEHRLLSQTATTTTISCSHCCVFMLLSVSSLG